MLPPPGVTSQASYSGTPRLPDGRTHPDEYVLDLRDPQKRMRIFEEMGAADDAVHTALDSRRQMINAANWTLASEDQTPNGQQVLEFVEDNLYPHLDNLIRWLGGGALQYGFGAIEPVFQWSDRPLVSSVSRGKVVRPTTKADGRRIYLAKLAHIRQRSVETFNISETGDLREVWQYVYNGVRFARVKIPAEKLLIWTYNQQGDDRWGVPPTRHCYKAWTFKTQIERLNVLAFDRFGVGIPVAEEGLGWTQAERDRLASFLKSFRSGDSAYVIHPNGGKIEILDGDGRMQMSALEWVKMYNIAIATAFLTQQDQVAGQTHGSRATVQTFYEHLEGIVQADCEDLANLVNNQLIVPLVNWNFGPQDTYPMFAPSQRIRAGSGIGQILQQLIAAGAIHVRPEDEVFLRDVMGLPEVAIETLHAEQQQRDAQTAAAAAAATKANAGDGSDPTDPSVTPIDKNKAAADKKPKVAATRALSAMATDTPAGTPDPAAPGQTSYRTAAYTAWEHGILRPDVLTRDLDLQTARLAGEVQDVLAAIDDELARQVASLAAQGPAVLASGVKSIAVPLSLRGQLAAVMLDAAHRARTYGAQAVRNEIERQLGPSGIGPQRAPSLYSAYTKDSVNTAAPPLDALEEQRLQAEVDGAVADEVDRREQSARSAALTVLAQAAGAIGSVLASVASTATKAALVGLSTGRTQQNVEGVVNVAFGVGRQEEADAIHEAATGGAGGGDNRSGLRDASGNPIDLVAKVYSAVMDGGTCDECAKWDGAEFPIDYAEDYTGVQCPNPRCAGGYDKCRCVWIYITNLESVPLVPAAKGPEPIRGGR